MINRKKKNENKIDKENKYNKKGKKKKNENNIDNRNKYNNKKEKMKKIILIMTIMMRKKTRKKKVR